MQMETEHSRKRERYVNPVNQVGQFTVRRGHPTNGTLEPAVIVFCPMLLERFLTDFLAKQMS